jgi:hypothetical protein
MGIHVIDIRPFHNTNAEIVSMHSDSNGYHPNSQSESISWNALKLINEKVNFFRFRRGVCVLQLAQEEAFLAPAEH